MIPAFGDIYLTKFDPALGHEYTKIRPALVIQEEKISKNSPYVTIMPISSKINRFQLNDVFIPKDAKNRLMSDSVIRVQQISSFDKQRFIKLIGRANSPVIRKVRGYIRRHFGL